MTTTEMNTPTTTIRRDLLRVNTIAVSAPDADTLRADLLRLVTKAVDGMNADRLQAVARFIDLLVNDRGAITPAEELITRLVRHHFIRPLDPEAVRMAVEEFEDHFEDCTAVMERFGSVYGKTGEEK